jgi:hypothetical protein
MVELDVGEVVAPAAEEGRQALGERMAPDRPLDRAGSRQLGVEHAAVLVEPDLADAEAGRVVQQGRRAHRSML